MSQRRFRVMGENIFLITHKLIMNQRLCRLLHYTHSNPLDPSLPDVNGIEILHKNVLLTPKIPDDLLVKENFIVVLLDRFSQDPQNKEFKIASVRFDIICQYEDWVIESDSLRPFLIMEEIDTMFNEQPLAGIGNLAFTNSDRLIATPDLGGYTLEYQVYEFN